MPSAAQNGETVVLLTDIAESVGILSIGKNITLDLAGHTLKADGVAIFANFGAIVDTGATKGLLIVPKGFLLMHNTTGSMLPVWNEENTGYVFFNARANFSLYKRGEDKFEFNFRPSLGSSAFNKAYFADGAADNGIQFKVNIHCMKNGVAAKVFTFTIDEKYIIDAYSSGKVIQMNITGAGASFDSYVMEIVMVSDTGMSWSSGMQESATFTPVAMTGLE